MGKYCRHWGDCEEAGVVSGYSGLGIGFFWCRDCVYSRLSLLPTNVDRCGLNHVIMCDFLVGACMGVLPFTIGNGEKSKQIVLQLLMIKRHTQIPSSSLNLPVAS